MIPLQLDLMIPLQLDLDRWSISMSILPWSTNTHSPAQTQCQHNVSNLWNIAPITHLIEHLAHLPIASYTQNLHHLLQVVCEGWDTPHTNVNMTGHTLNLVYAHKHTHTHIHTHTPSTGSYPHMRPVHTTNPPLMAHMCTVSHCLDYWYECKQCQLQIGVMVSWQWEGEGKTKMKTKMRGNGKG